MDGISVPCPSHNPISQNGPPAPARCPASFNMMERSHAFWLREVLAGSATRIFPSFTPRSTIKCPPVVKWPGDMIATASLPLLSASKIRYGSLALHPSTGRPQALAALGISEW